MRNKKLKNWLVKNKYQQHIYLISMLLLMAIITGGGNRVNFSTSMYFALVQVCCILIPGMALIDCIYIKGITNIENVLLSYSAGYALGIYLYFFTRILNIYEHLNGIYILVFVISLIIIVIRRSRDENVQCTDWRWVWLISILYVISFIVFSCRYTLPTYIESNQYFDDLLYWAGDAVELNKEFPPINFRTMQPDYQYHYFSALQLAVISKITGTSITRIAFTYSYIQSIVLMGFSAYCLTARMIKDGKVQIVTLLLLFFSTGFEKETLVTYFWHIYLLPMGFNIAYGYEMVIILLLLIEQKKEKMSITNLIWMMIFLGICTGTKGPAGAIVLVGMGVSCLQWLHNKKYKKAFGYGISALCIFVVVYFLFMKGALKVYDTYVQMRYTDDGGTLSKTLGFIRYTLLLNPWTVWAALIYICIRIIKKKIRSEEVMFTLMIGTGICLGYFINMSGVSQMYFSLSVFGFIAIIAGRGIDSFIKMNAIKSMDRRKKMWFYRGVICVFLVSMPVHIMKFSWHRNNLKDGISNFIGMSTFDEADRLTNEEYEAYDWVRTNTDDMSLLLSDRQLIGDVFTSGVFAERHVYYYQDEKELNQGKELFSGGEEYLQQFINKGIDYVVQTKRISPKFSAGEEYCKKVFENSDIAVWEIIN